MWTCVTWMTLHLCYLAISRVCTTVAICRTESNTWLAWRCFLCIACSSSVHRSLFSLFYMIRSGLIELYKLSTSWSKIAYCEWPESSSCCSLWYWLSRIQIVYIHILACVLCLEPLNNRLTAASSLVCDDYTFVISVDGKWYNLEKRALHRRRTRQL